MPNPDLTERIRTIFLHDKARVTIAEAADMLGWTRAEMNAAIKDGDIEPVTTCSGKMIELCDVAGKALELWSLATVEEALGREASLVMPPAVRTRKLMVRIPLYQIAVLKILAEEGAETVDTLLERMFNELADNERERLEARIPGLSEAIRWPEVVVETQLPS
jgi:hypothetical protein